MKIRVAGTLAGLALSFAVATFAQQKETVDPQIDRQIRVLAMKFDEAFNKHDASAVAALYAQDAVLGTYDHGTFHGRQAIEKAYANWNFKRWQASNYFTTVTRVIEIGDQVRSTGTWSCVFQNSTGGPGSDSGRYSWVVVREGDSWKIRRDTSSGTAGTLWGTNH